MDENNNEGIIKNDSNNIGTSNQIVEKNETKIEEIMKDAELNQVDKIMSKQDSQPVINTTVEQLPKDKKGFSIAALVLGIVAIVLCCVWYISIPCGILAIVFGSIGLKSSKRGMSISGIVTGIIGMIISIFIILMLVIFGFALGITGIVKDIIDENSYLDSYEYDHDYDSFYNF